MRTKGLPPNRVKEILDELEPVLDKYDPLNISAALSIILVNCGPEDKKGFLKCMEHAYNIHRSQ